MTRLQKALTSLMLGAAFASVPVIYLSISAAPASAQATDTTDGTSSSGSKRVSRLGELLVLNNLFAGGTILGNNATNTMAVNGGVDRLGELLVLDNLFGTDEDASSDTNGNKRISRIGELIVLNNLFAGGRVTGASAMNGTTAMTGVDRLGELIVLDNLFR